MNNVCDHYFIEGKFDVTKMKGKKKNQLNFEKILMSTFVIR